MTKTQTPSRLVVAIALCCLGPMASAAGMTSFVGVGVGNTSANVPGSSGQVSSSSSGYRLVAGNLISPALSVEAEYIDLGEIAGSSTKIAAKGLGISGLFVMPVTEMFSVYGRAGLARIETTVSSLPGSTPITPVYDTTVGLTLGYGIQADISPNASLRISWDRYKCSALASSPTDRIDMNSSALMIFRF